MGLIFIHPFLLHFDVSKYLYLGFIPPNIWHNSTIIFAAPFAFLLFIASYVYLVNPTKRFYYLVLFLSILNILAKPSYFFVFAISFPLLCLFEYKISKTFFTSLSIVIIGIVILSVYSLWLYNDPIMLNIIQNGQKSGITISWLHEWKKISDNIPRDFLLSIAFPLTCLILYFRALISEKITKYAIISYFFSIIIWLFIQETGCRDGHANFIWQANIAGNILYLTISMLYWRILNEKKYLLNWKDIIIINVFIWQILSGILYTYKLLYINDFL
jgi:hypothetical protein